MTRTFFKIVSLFLLLGSASVTQAHDDLGFISTNVVNNNIAIGDTIFIQTKLLNYNDHPFHDFIDFNLAVNNLLIHDPSIFPNPFHGQIVDIGPGDSLPLTFIIIAKPGPFLTGPNGVVIWPAFNSDTSQAHDIISTQIFARLPTGVNEPLKDKLRAWVHNKTLYIINQGITEQVSELQLFDLNGKQVYQTQTSWPFEIPMNGWAGGVYIANLRFRNGESVALKINTQ